MKQSKSNIMILLALFLIGTLVVNNSPVTRQIVPVPDEVDIYRSQILFVWGYMKRDFTVTFDLDPDEDYLALPVNVDVTFIHIRSQRVFVSSFEDELDGSTYTLSTVLRRMPAGFYFIEVHITSLGPVISLL